MRSRWLALVLLGILPLATSCSYFVIDTAKYIAPPPELRSAAPRLLDFSATPADLIAGRTTTVRFVISYEDWNEDVGPSEAKVQFEFRKVSGNFTMNASGGITAGRVVSQGHTGQVLFGLDVGITYGAEGVLEVEAALFDELGQLSTPLKTQLSISTP